MFFVFVLIFDSVTRQFDKIASSRDHKLLSPQTQVLWVATMRTANQLQQSTAVLEPTAYDVLLGRHRHCFHHFGNQAFRTLIARFTNRYATLTNKREKMNVVTLILHIIENGGGRFLRESNSYWVVVKGRTAREKISHALKDHVNRITFHNTNATSQGNTSNETLQQRSDLQHISQTCWRTLVFETVQNQEGKKSRKQGSIRHQEETTHEHLNTKNGSLFLSDTHQHVAGLQQALSANAVMDTTTRHQGANTLTSTMPMPHHWPTMVTAQSLAQPQAPLPNKFTIDFPGNIWHSNLEHLPVFTSEGGEQVEKNSSTTSSTALARRNQGHAVAPHLLQSPSLMERASYPPITHQFNIPRRPRLFNVHGSVETGLPPNDETMTRSTNDDMSKNETSALFASDPFRERSMMRTGDTREADEAVLKPLAQSNELVRFQQDYETANIFDAHHEEEQSIDPIPFHPIQELNDQVQPVQVFPPQQEDTHYEPSAHNVEEQEQTHRREGSRSTDQQIDSMLIDLFQK